MSVQTLIINRSKQTFNCAPNCELEYNFISIMFWKMYWHKSIHN